MGSLQLQGSTSGSVTLTVPDVAGASTLLLPAINDTLVGLAATQTLTNKTLQGGAITSATAQASTSGTSIDFTSIPSYVKRITVMVQGLSFAGASGIGRVQIGTGGVLTTTGYTSDSITVTGANTCNNSNYVNGLAIFNGNVVADTLWGVTTITNLSGNTWIATFNSCRSDNGSSRTGTGFITLGGALDIVSVVATTGSFDAGTINIMYE
jgi:hypothetical protein